MSSQEVIESLLRGIAEGQEQKREELLEVLADSYVFTPISHVQDIDSGDGGHKFNVPTFFGGDRKLIPAFTGPDYFQAWSQNRFQCLNVSGADLAIAIPADAWVMINPGSPDAAQLSPEELNIVRTAEIDLENLPQVDAAAAEPVPEEPAQELSVELPQEVRPAEVEAETAYEEQVLPEEPAPDYEEPKPLAANDLLETLYTILSNYDEVKEAYYLSHQSESSEGCLGLLVENLGPEQRFCLMADIAEAAKSRFDIAGAIEVYDDLHLSSSASWELFKSLTPFLEKERTGYEEENAYPQENYAEDYPSELTPEVERLSDETAEDLSIAAPQGGSIFSKIFKRGAA